MFRFANAYRFATQKGHNRCGNNRIMHTCTHNARRRRSMNSVVHLAQSSSQSTSIQYHQSNNREIQLLILSRNYMIAAVSANADSVTSSASNPSSVVLCLDLECGSIDDDDDG